MIKRNVYFLADQLYLSNGAIANSSEHLIENKIDTVFNLCGDEELSKELDCTEVNSHGNLVEYVLYPLPDVPSADFPVQLHLDHLVGVLEEKLSSNHTCLIHCVSGINRSPTLVIAFLMKSHKWTLKYAMEYTIGKIRRICISPHYMNHLQIYESRLTEQYHLKSSDKPFI